MRFPPRMRSKRLGWILRFVVGMGLLGLVLRANRDEIAGILARKPDPSAFAVGLSFYVLGLLLAYARWYMLVRAVAMAFRFRDAVRLGLIGAFFNFVIPGAVFGNAVRAGFLCREQPEDKPKAIASVLVDFLAGLAGLFLIAAIVSTWEYGRLDPRMRRLVPITWVAVGLAGLAMAMVFLRRGEGKKAAAARAFRSRWWAIPLAVGMGIGTHALNVLAFAMVSVAMFGASVPGLVEHFLIVPMVLFTTAVPLPFGALGVSEQASAGLFGLMGYPGGAVAMLGFRLLQFTGAAVGGCVYMANAKELKTMAEDPPSSS